MIANNLELGNLMFNTNKNQCYECPYWFVVLLSELGNQLERVMHNMGEKYYDNPFENTANSFENNIFKVQAYSWNDDEVQPYNFKCDNVKVSWYKYLGRDTTINEEYDVEFLVNIFNKCLDSILEMEKEYFKNKRS